MSARAARTPAHGWAGRAGDGAGTAQSKVEERDASQGVLRKYVYGAGIDDRIAMLDAGCAGGGRCFYLTNWQGSATTLVNQDGTLNAVYHYGPYGEGTNWTPSDALTGNPFRFTGRRVDPETGLYYYRARYYSPRTGRFLQTDPVGTKDDLSLYAYVRNDPLNRADPSGLAEYQFGLDLEMYVGGGGHLGGSVTFDTQSLELGVVGNAGIGGGLGGGLGLVLERSAGSGVPARDSTATSSSIRFSANVGPFGISKNTPVTENGESVIGRSDENSESLTKELPTPRVTGELKPQLKVGGSATFEYSVKKTTSALPKGMQAISKGVEKMGVKIKCIVTGSRIPQSC